MSLMDEQMRERRDRILEAARELLAERGYAAVTVRELAERCGVSVPTLYNRFESKDALIAEAVQDHFQTLLRAASSGDEAPGQARLLAIVGRCVEEVTRLSDYHRALLGAFARAPETGPLHGTLAADLVSAVSAELETMARRRQLARWVRIDQLAAQITTACISAAMAWAAGGVVDARLRAFAEQSVGLMLLGVVRGTPRAELETRLQAAQDVLAGAVAHAPAGDVRQIVK
jgi:AcrR family transcriptional regulator